MADDDEGEAEASPPEGQRLEAQAPEPRPAVGSAVEATEGHDPDPDAGDLTPVTPDRASPRGHPGARLDRPPAEALGAATVEAARDGPDPTALVEGLRENLARAGTATRGALERAQRLTGRAIDRVRNGAGQAADDAGDHQPEASAAGRRPPVPPTEGDQGPRTPILEAHRTRGDPTDGDAPDEGFRLLAVGPPSRDEEPPTPTTPDTAPVRAPEPDHDAPPARPSPRGRRVPVDVEAGPPVQAPGADGQAPPATPPTVDEETTVPVSEDDEDDEGLFASLRDRLSRDEDPDETTSEPDDEEAEEAEEPDADEPGLFARLRDRFGSSGGKPEVEAAEQVPEPAGEEEPEAVEDEAPTPSPSVDRARPDEPAQHAPEPPSRGDPIPARPEPSTEPGSAIEDRPTPEREPSPEQARHDGPAASPTPAPPSGEATVPAQPAGTPTLAQRDTAEDDPEPVEEEPEEADAPEDDASEAPNEEPASERPAPEEPDEPAADEDDGAGVDDLHDRIDEVLDRNERRPGSVLAGRSSSR